MKKFNLTLVEMYAIKHALQKQVEERRAELKELEEISVLPGDSCADDFIINDIDTLKKDIAHECELISLFETNILDYRNSKVERSC